MKLMRAFHIAQDNIQNNKVLTIDNYITNTKEFFYVILFKKKDRNDGSKATWQSIPRRK